MSFNSASLLTLPDRLLARIIASISDHVNRYCFGLTCVRLFALCEERWLKRYHTDFQRPRLLCVGDYSPWDAIGRTAFQEFRTLQHRTSAFNIHVDESTRTELFCFEDTKKMKNPFDVAEYLEDLPKYSADSQRDALSTSLSILGEKVWKRIRQDADGDVTLSSLLATSGKVVSGILLHPEALVLHRSLINPRTTLLKASQLGKQTTVLRNHTKRVFVTERPLFTGFKKRFGHTAPTFAQAVLSQICRSNQDDRTMIIDLGGPWAGDELDIVSEGEFLENLKILRPEEVKAWGNVSNQMLTDLWELLFAAALDLSPETERWKISLEKQIKLRGRTAEDFLRQSLT